MTRDEFVSEMIEQAKSLWDRYWTTLPDEQRLRLAGMEVELLGIERELRRRLWGLVGASLEALAQEQVQSCRCGRRRERRAGSVTVDVLGEQLELPCSYFYCRRCHEGVSPVRRWLSVESGGASLGFERALTDLTTSSTWTSTSSS